MSAIWSPLSTRHDGILLGSLIGKIALGLVGAGINWALLWSTIRVMHSTGDSPWPVHGCYLCYPNHGYVIYSYILLLLTPDRMYSGELPVPISVRRYLPSSRKPKYCPAFCEGLGYHANPGLCTIQDSILGQGPYNLMMEGRTSKSRMEESKWDSGCWSFGYNILLSVFSTVSTLTVQDLSEGSKFYEARLKLNVGWTTYANLRQTREQTGVTFVTMSIGEKLWLSIVTSACRTMCARHWQDGC
jgi:hypothetical protein